MSQPVRVFLSPLLFEPEDVQGGAAVVIDQLRASTTVAYALGAGAAAVVPCLEVEKARERAAGLPGALLGGERGGVKIEGFDLGNSPTEYTVDRVLGKTIVFTTTNGTRALRRAAAAKRAMTGSLANRTAVVEAARATGLPVFLVCAGIHGAVCAEDVLAAGAIAAALKARGAELVDDSAMLAAAVWEEAGDGEAAIERALHASHGGRNLAKVGLSTDVEVCARVDAVGCVPVVDQRGWLVRGT